MYPHGLAIYLVRATLERTPGTHRHRHVNSKCKVMDDVQRIDAEIFPDWPNSWERVGRRRAVPCEPLQHHGQMRNDVVFAVRLYTAGLTARESPIFWNNKIVRENGFSGTVTLPLYRRGTSPRFSVETRCCSSSFRLFQL